MTEEQPEDLSARIPGRAGDCHSPHLHEYATARMTMHPVLERSFRPRHRLTVQNEEVAIVAKKKGPLGKVIGVLAAGLTVAAVVQELAKPADQRTWHGRIAYVPYDFRIPTVDRLLASWW